MPIQLLAESSSGGGNGAVLMVVLIVGYFLPSIIAKVRHVSSFGSVFIINFFLGWTFIGWVVALAMAARSAPPSLQSFAPPRGMEAVACPRCNEVQNIPLGQTTLECWRCKYIARRSGASEGQDEQPGTAAPLEQPQSLRDIWHDHLSGETLSQTSDDLRQWWKSGRWRSEWRS
jgi:hypothetical protein